MHGGFFCPYTFPSDCAHDINPSTDPHQDSESLPLNAHSNRAINFLPLLLPSPRNHNTSPSTTKSSSDITSYRLNQPLFRPTKPNIAATISSDKPPTTPPTSAPVAVLRFVFEHAAALPLLSEVWAALATEEDDTVTVSVTVSALMLVAVWSKVWFWDWSGVWIRVWIGVSTEVWIGGVWIEACTTVMLFVKVCVCVCVCV